MDAFDIEEFKKGLPLLTTTELCDLLDMIEEEIEARVENYGD